MRITSSQTIKKIMTILISVGLSSSALAKTYYWVDKDDKKHFSDTPPPISQVKENTNKQKPNFKELNTAKDKKTLATERSKKQKINGSDSAQVKAEKTRIQDEEAKLADAKRRVANGEDVAKVDAELKEAIKEPVKIEQKTAADKRMAAEKKRLEQEAQQKEKKQQEEKRITEQKNEQARLAHCQNLRTSLAAYKNGRVKEYNSKTKEHDFLDDKQLADKVAKTNQELQANRCGN
jgi:colicin import membrane protein